MPKIFPLPNNCWCSNNGPAIHPVNWNSARASTKKKWYVHYRFHDPAFPKPKQVMVKGGVNEFTELAHRQQAIRILWEQELAILNEGYNPITGDTIPPSAEPGFEISERTPFIEAMKWALDKVECEKETKIDITSMMRYFEKSAITLGRSRRPLIDIKRKDIRLILDNCKNVTVKNKKGIERKKIWTNNQFNHFRKYLHLLYSQLEQFDVIEYNPVTKIALKETVQRIPDVLTNEERKLISEKLSITHPRFLMFINIFFHSGSRRSELFRLQGKHVDLENQRWKTIVKKGKKKREVWKTIKDIALPYWEEAMKDCGPDEYVFTKFLMPSRKVQKPMLPEYVTRLWRKLVKEDLGINKNFYWLKHLHTTEVIDILDDNGGTQMAAEHNSHTSQAMVINIYDVRRQQRKHNRMKKLNNAF